MFYFEEEPRRIPTRPGKITLVVVNALEENGGSITVEPLDQNGKSMGNGNSQEWNNILSEEDIVTIEIIMSKIRIIAENSFGGMDGGL